MGRKALTELEAKELLEKYGIPFPKRGVAKSEEEAVKVAKEIGFPVVMKILSPDIVHKTDVGGVMLNIKNEDEVREAWRKIMENVKSKAPDARIEGVLIEKMVEGGHEVIIGGLRDPVFGPVVMFGGFGGVLVELFKDVSFRLAPIDEEEAEEMMKETKGYKVLAGYRGAFKGDVESLKETLVKVSKLMAENEKIVELDLNPVRVFEKGLVVLDAKIIVSE